MDDASVDDASADDAGVDDATVDDAGAQDAVAQGREAEVERERRQLVNRLERLRRETEATRARAEALGETLINLAGDEAKLGQRLEETGARVRDLEARVAADEEALDRLTAEQARLRQTLAERRTELASVLAALQRIGRHPPPALLSGPSGALGTVRGAILLNEAIPELDASAQQLAADLARAARLAEEERDRWTRLTADLDELIGERQRLTALGEELERRRALSAFERDETAAELARLAQETDGVNELMARLTEEAEAASEAAARDFEGRRGALEPPVAGAVVSRFGDVTGAGDLATGRTIAALPEASVFAPMDATVLFSAPFRGYGHVLILDAGDGYHMVLAGMERASVSPGDEVAAGTPLGRMGRSGQRSTAATVGVDGATLLGARPALYVELRRGGSAIDSHGWWQADSAQAGRTSG